MNLQPLTHDWTRQDNTRTGSHSMEPVPCCTMAFLCKVRQDLGSQSREPVTPSKAAGICRALQTLVTQALESEPLVPQVVLSGPVKPKETKSGMLCPYLPWLASLGPERPCGARQGNLLPLSQLATRWPESPWGNMLGSYSSLVHRWSSQDNTGQGSSAS